MTPPSNPIVLAVLAALALVCITVLAALQLPIPDVLTTALVLLVGAAAGAAVPRRTNDSDPVSVPNFRNVHISGNRVAGHVPPDGR